MRPGRGHVGVILHAESTHPPDGRHALIEADEATIHAAAVHTAAVLRAPRVILGFSYGAKHGCCGENTKREQQ